MAEIEGLLARGIPRTALPFGGLVYRAGEEASAEVVRRVPAERLLVETDAPYLAAPSAPRRRNEPAFVAATAAVLAEVKSASTADIARATTANVTRLFSKMPAVAA